MTDQPTHLPTNPTRNELIERHWFEGDYTIPEGHFWNWYITEKMPPKDQNPPESN